MLYPKSCYNEPCYKEVEIIVSHVSHVEMHPFANYFPWLGRGSSSSFEVSETNMRIVACKTSVSKLGLR